jgi:hypothetical protein
MTASVFLLNSSAQALATISASASQILIVMTPPNVFTLEQRVAQCIRQNAWMKNGGQTPVMGRLKGLSRVVTGV